MHLSADILTYLVVFYDGSRSADGTKNIEQSKIINMLERKEDK